MKAPSDNLMQASRYLARNMAWASLFWSFITLVLGMRGDALVFIVGSGILFSCFLYLDAEGSDEVQN